MHTVTRVLIVTGLILTVGVKPSWGGAPPNNIASDANGNTAGGTGALSANTTASTLYFIHDIPCMILLLCLNGLL